MSIEQEVLAHMECNLIEELKYEKIKMKVNLV